MKSRKQVAVIGGGIAGLSTAWYLKDNFEVTLFEKHAIPGMDAHAVQIDIEGESQRFDIPFRVLKEDHYINLLQLYKDANIDITRVDYSFTISNSDGNTYFGYRNRSILGFPYSMITSSCLRTKFGRQIFSEMYRFYNKAIKLSDEGLTIDEFLNKHGFSNDFRYYFLYPIYCTLNTCSIPAVASYPIEAYQQYHTAGNKVGGVFHTVKGTSDVVKKLSRSINRIITNAAINNVQLSKQSNGVQIRYKNQSDRTITEEFDYVIMATQANQAHLILDHELKQEKEALSFFSYESSEITIHTDNRYMPAHKKKWLPVSFLVPENCKMPAGTIWLNRLIPSLTKKPEIFQTWNPFLDTPPDKIIGRAIMERPIMDFNSLTGVKLLQELHARESQRIYFTGSYARAGVPLLEAGVSTAKKIAALLIDRLAESRLKTPTISL